MRGSTVVRRGGAGSLALMLALVVVPAVAHAVTASAALIVGAGQDAVTYQMTPGHTGASMDRVGPQWSQSWTKNLGGPVSYPLLAGGEAFVVVDSSSDPSLDAFNASTGAPLWEVAVSAGPSGIAFDGGRVFESSANVTSAYDAHSGALDWSIAQTSLNAAPTVADGVLYLGQVVAVNESTGAVLWDWTDPNGNDDGSSPAVMGNGVFVSSSCDSWEINRATGVATWAVFAGCSCACGWTTVASGGNLFLRSHVLNASTGAIESDMDAGPSPAVDNSNIYAENDGTLTAQTIGGSLPLWSFTGDGHLDSPPIVDDGVVYEGSSSGELYAVAAATGLELWSTNVGAPIAPPVPDIDSFWGLAEGDGMLAVPAGDTLSVFTDPSTPPAAPTAVSAVASGSQASVRWTVPADNGSPINSFTITPTVDGIVQTPFVVAAGMGGSATDATPGATDTATVTGLSGASDVSGFAVAANNGGGQGPGTEATAAPSVTSASGAVFGLGQTESFTVTTTGNPTSTLTESGPLPEGVTFADNGDGTATLAGAAGAGTLGSYPVTITAANGVGLVATQSFVLSIDPAVSFTSAPATTFTAGSLATFTFGATGSPAPTFSVSGALPFGVSLTRAGVLSGNPQEGGSYPLTVTASNGVVPDASQSFVLTVDVDPVMDSIGSVAFAVGQANVFLVSASGNPTPTFTESGTLPAGVTFTDNGNGTATVAGAPTSASIGLTQILITASNGVGTDATERLLLTVGVAPVMTSAAGTTFTVGSPGSFSFGASGSPAPTFSLAAGSSLPAGVIMSNGVLTGTPSPGSGGLYRLVLVAANGVTPSATQDFLLEVDGPPTFTSQGGAEFAQGSFGLLTVSATGFPRPTLSESGSLPSGVAFVDNGNGTGRLSGKPDPGTFGSYPVTITAHSSFGPDAIESFILTVGTPPSAITSTGSTTFTAGVAGSFTFMADGFPGASFSTSGSMPPGVSLSPGGVLQGTPFSETPGTYSFTVNATNGIGSPVSQLFVLTVNARAQFTSAPRMVFVTGVPGSITVTTAGAPVPALSESGALPSGMAFADQGNGTATVSGTPDNGTAGTYPIALTATNGAGGPVTQDFVLSVDQPLVITSAGSDTFTQGSPGSFPFQISGPLPSPIFSESGPLPAGVSLRPAGVLSGTPGPGTSGRYPVTVDASNGVIPDATQSFTLLVAGPPVITSNAETIMTPLSPDSYSVVARGFPEPTFTETGALPSGVTMSTHGVLFGTPAQGSQGVYPITVVASNGIGPDATQAFNIYVGFVIVQTSLPDGNLRQGYSADLTTFGGDGPFTWSATGKLPLGLRLSKRGELLGKPKATGSFTFAVHVTATNRKVRPHTQTTATQTFSITIT
jgi:outer membrane protein assembly factor BamB